MFPQRGGTDDGSGPVPARRLRRHQRDNARDIFSHRRGSSGTHNITRRACFHAHGGHAGRGIDSDGGKRRRMCHIDMDSVQRPRADV